MTTPFLLIDGSSYLFRAYHALPELTTATGQPTGAIYGVINMLKKCVAEYQPVHFAVVFDTKGKNFRHALYPEYKANRGEMPEDLAAQIGLLHDVIRALGYPLIAVPGVEADDVIATLAQQAAAEGQAVLISTGDKDFAQVVDERITLVNTMTQKTLDVPGVVEKFGVRPDQIIDYLALMGDAVDNVPGIPKVGPKTAAKWLAQYDTLDHLIAHAHEVSGKVGENLRANLTQLVLAKKLVTIRCDVDVDAGWQSLTISEPDTGALRELYSECEFNGWLKLLGGEAVSAIPGRAAPKMEYETILTETQFAKWLELLAQAETVALDTETTSLDAMQARLVGLSFSVDKTQAAYLPLAHDYLGAPAQLDTVSVLAQLNTVLAGKCVVGQNLKYDWKVLAEAGLELQGDLRDTMLQSYMLGNKKNNLDSLAQQYLNRETIHFEDIAGKGKKQLTFNQIALEQAAPYAAEDAEITFNLYHLLQERLDTSVMHLLATVEYPLMQVLAKMERRGVLLDVDLLVAQSVDITEQLVDIEKKIYAEAGEIFNIASTKQLGEIFFEKLGLPVIKKTPKGKPSTADAVLQVLAKDYPLPALIVRFRSLTKLKTTYLDSLPLQVNPKTGRVHTAYHQAVTSTGRLSSKDPNLQNIPVKTNAGRAIRKAFIAPARKKIISLDYSQIELRIMAHLSQDEGLLEAFKQGLDVHRATASEVFGVSVEKVAPGQRRSAKAINFGLIYGMSAFGLAQQLGIERNEAQAYIDVYFKRYPGVLRYMEETRALAHEQGFVSTLLGRRLWLPEIHSKNGMLVKAAERAAINAPMQGTAADIIKLAMIAVDEWISGSDLDVSMLMQVHDELIFEVADADVKEAMQKIKHLMESAMTLSVPLLVDGGVGDNWEEAH